MNTTVNASAGETGTLSLAIRNAGTVGAFDASVVVNSTDSGIRFGNNATTAETSVGEWLRGDTKYVEFPLQVAPDTDRNVTAQVRVAYESRTGERRLSEPLFIGIRPEGKPSFAVRDVRSTVRVGDTGTVSGRVVNTGNRTLDDATLVFTPSNGTALRPEETQFPLGRLRNNSSGRFRFEVDATNATNPGPRDFTARVTYRDASGARRVSDPISVPVRVKPRREPFVVTATDANFTVDSSGTLRVRVRNDAGKRLSNVTARLLVSDPLSSDDSESYVGVLEPNDSTTASFQLTVSGEAIPDRHPGRRRHLLRDAERGPARGGTVRRPGDDSTRVRPWVVGAVGRCCRRGPGPRRRVVASTAIAIITTGEVDNCSPPHVPTLEQFRGDDEERDGGHGEDREDRPRQGSVGQNLSNVEVARERDVAYPVVIGAEGHGVHEEHPEYRADADRPGAACGVEPHRGDHTEARAREEIYHRVGVQCERIVRGPDGFPMNPTLTYTARKVNASTASMLGTSARYFPTTRRVRVTG